MTYEQLFTEIQNPENKVLKKVICMMGGLENVKYSLRGKKKILFYALGSEAGKYAPEWVIRAVFIDGEKQQSYSTEQIVSVFAALHNKYAEEERKQAVIAKKIERVM